jgi:hypothetical protein
MRIDNVLPSYVFSSQITPGRYPVSTAGQEAYMSSPGVSVDISPEAWTAYKQGKERQMDGVGEGVVAASDLAGCETCKNRRYRDVSNDSSVSFQAPTRISPSQAAVSIVSHESEHVLREQVKAAREDRKVISQTVTFKTSVCPECGRIYVSGGVTRTTTAEEYSASPDKPSEI